MTTTVLLATLALASQPQTLSETEKLGSVHERLILDGWQFSRDRTTWESVSVPHDWAIGGAFHETNDLQVTRIRQDGELVVTVEAGTAAGPCRVNAVSKGLKPASAEIQVK